MKTDSFGILIDDNDITVEVPWEQSILRGPATEHTFVHWRTGSRKCGICLLEHEANSKLLDERAKEKLWASVTQ